MARRRRSWAKSKRALHGRRGRVGATTEDGEAWWEIGDGCVEAASGVEAAAWCMAAGDDDVHVGQLRKMLHAK